MYESFEKFTGEEISADEALNPNIGRRGLLALLTAGGGTLAFSAWAAGATTAAASSSAATNGIVVVAAGATSTTASTAAATVAATAASAAATATAAAAAAAAAAKTTKLAGRPATLGANAITIDLTNFDPTKRYPGWDGRQATQASTGIFPRDRDLLIIGHRTKVWSGGGYIRGGRNVQWLGGAYSCAVYTRNFMGDASIEGVLVRFPLVMKGTETGDAIAVSPDPLTLGASKVSVLNCRVENIDGFFDGDHGDCFQVPPTCDATGWSSCARQIVIERFTGSTGYGGFFLPNQHFDAAANGYAYSTKGLSLTDVNLRRTHCVMMRDGTQRESGGLIYMIDMANSKRGDAPYSKTFRNVFVEPMAGQTINDLIYPSLTNAGGVNPYTKVKLAPVVSSGGHSATYPSQMMLDGMIEFGPPPGGDFARAADVNYKGGLNIPGIGYLSPGYI